MATILDVRKETARGSTRRLLMLLCLLAVACAYMFYVMALTLQPESFERCLGEVGLRLELLPPGLTTVDSDAFEICRKDAADGAATIAVAGTGAVLVVAALVYWLLPAWRWRRGRLLPVERIAEPAQAGESLPAHVKRLAQEAGVRRTPVFAVDPHALSAGAVAFGRAGRYTVCLHAGLVPLRTTEPETFEAVLRHELAHVDSRDVDVAYLTVALWRVVSLAVLAPFVLIQTWLLARDLLTGTDRIDWVEATPSVGKLAFALFLVAQVYLARNEILRSRELCADLDAVAAGADPRVWDPRLRGVPVDADGGVAPPPGWFTRLWHSHPAWHHRYGILAGGQLIFASGRGGQAVLAFAAMFGVVASIQGMPAWLLVTIVYVVGPIVVTTLIVSTSRKNAGVIRISEETVDYRRRVVRPFVPLTALTALFTTLMVYDPLEGFHDGILTYPAPTMPYPYDLSRSVGPFPASAATIVWLDDGGLDAVVELRRSVDVDVERLLAADPDSPELAAHCADITDAAEAGRALAPLPNPFASARWELMLFGAEAGSVVVCDAASPAASLRIRRERIERHYEFVRDEYEELVEELDRYILTDLPDFSS